MNVEKEGGAITEFWPQCRNEVINGLYPLRRLLNGSDHGAVFATECAAQGLLTAAVKIVPAERVTLAQLSHWRTAAALSHPHLIRLFDAGLCQLSGRQFLFVVMEYADQTLSQVLLHRPLTGDEVQEMLPSVLNALAFLHGKNLVQGQLRPANILVVDDQVKLASDTVRPAGESRRGAAKPSSYDPPEAENDRLSPAGDIWALGISIVEALTQRLPKTADIQSVATCLPTTLAPAFVLTIQRCLSHDPANRPTAVEMEAQCKRGPQPPPNPVTLAVDSETPARVLHPREAASRRGLATTIATVLALSVAGWVGLRMFQSHPKPNKLAASALQSPRQGAAEPAAVSQTPGTPDSANPQRTAAAVSAKPRRSEPPPPRTVAGPLDQPTQAPAEVLPPVVHEQIPIAPRSALETIQGHVRVAVRVIVDPSGDVAGVLVENPGPSAYFARLAKDAAKHWKFVPADTQDSRQWLLRFEFTREGSTGHAVTPRS